MVKHLVTVVETEFPKVLALAVALGDLLSGSHLAGTAGLDWTALTAAAASVGLSIRTEAVWHAVVKAAGDEPTTTSTK